MKSVLRSLEVLELISQHQPITVGELSRLLDLPKSTVQRTLVTLHEAGWLRQASEAITSWEVSSKILTIRPRVLLDGDLIAAARLPMTDLRDTTNETIHLTVPNGMDGVILIDRVDCDQPVRSFMPIGHESPYATTATGKAVLAYRPESEIDAVLARTPSNHFEATPKSIAELKRELKRIRKQGYAVNLGAYRVGVCAVGAPILDGRGQAIASICISLPMARYDKAQLPAWGEAVKAAANRIGQHTL